MIVIVTGGRRFTDGAFLFSEMDRLHAELGITMVVEGGQRTYQNRRPIGGADFFAKEWAVARGIEVKTVYAAWGDIDRPGAKIRVNARGKKYDADAGFVRNQLMLDRHPPGRLIAFKGGGGTRDMMRRAELAGVPVIGMLCP